MKKNISIMISIFLVTVLCVYGIAAAADSMRFGDKELRTAGQERYVPDEIIVKFNPGADEDSIIAKQGASLKSVGYLNKFKVLKVPKGKTVEEMVDIYSKNPNVEYVEPNYILTASYVPNDPYYSYQWNFDNDEYGGIGMEKAWDITTGSNSVIVAVVDTGVAYENREERLGRLKIRYYIAPDLSKTCFKQGYDFINNDDHPNDDEGHGTHVTGTIAQNTNNQEGVAGIAFDTCIMPVKVLDRNGGGSDVSVADGIYFAADNGADIISLSLGGPSYSQTLKEAVEYAYNEKGVTVIAASGNENSAVSYPAAYDDYVIAVGATNYIEERAGYSNYGPSLDIVAPGGDGNDYNGDGYMDGVLQQTFGSNPGDFGYYFYTGTSMATPHVSGVAALLIAKGIASTPDQIRKVLQTTADDLGDPGKDQFFGYGLLNADAALAYSSSPECSEDEDCDDGLFCNGAETCVSGTCTSGTPIVCDDGLFCNGAETCDEESDECVSGTPPSCDDGNSCTDDSCDEDEDSCVNDPVVEGTLCEDGLYCNGVETCVSGTCTSGTPIVCDDGLFCNGAETCDEESDECVSGTPPSCDDEEICTTDYCDSVKNDCVNDPVADGTLCEDGLYCNGVETCVSGTCTSGTPVVCDDELFCNGLESCNEETDNCDAGTAPTCDDGDPCTTDSCDDSEGCIYTLLPGCQSTVCGNDICEAGEDCYTCADDCRCQGRDCVAGCCGDGRVSGGENPSNCPIDFI